MGEPRGLSRKPGDRDTLGHHGDRREAAGSQDRMAVWEGDRAGARLEGPGGGERNAAHSLKTSEWRRRRMSEV